MTVEAVASRTGTSLQEWVLDKHKDCNDRSLIVRAENLHYGYQGANGLVSVLSGLNLHVQKNEFVSIIGASGSGKSSLLYLLGGMESPSSGRIEVGGKCLQDLSGNELEAYRQNQVSFVFQFFNLLPSLTAKENVLLGMEAMGLAEAQARERAKSVLASVGLAGKEDRFPLQLSGGEQQRVAIARALAKRVPLILADEPTGNLDEQTAQEVMELLVRVQSEYQAAVVLITHDMDIARRADRILLLRKGTLEEIRPDAVAAAVQREK